MKKAGMIAAGLLAAIFWGDVLLDFFVTAVELLLETIELVTEHVLEALLALTPYEAQAVTAWLGFGILMVALFFAFKRLSLVYQRAKSVFPVWWQAQKERVQVSWTGIAWQTALTGMVLMLLLLYL
jgi:hypothetical protein